MADPDHSFNAFIPPLLILEEYYTYEYVLCTNACRSIFTM